MKDGDGELLKIERGQEMLVILSPREKGKKMKLMEIGTRNEGAAWGVGEARKKK